MGQQTSQLHELLTCLQNEADFEEIGKLLFNHELQNLSYEDLLKLLGELNKFSQMCLKSDGYRIIFAINKGTDTSVLWKTTIKIACVKLESHTNRILYYRLFTLSEFLNIVKNIRDQRSAVTDSLRFVENSDKFRVIQTFNYSEEQQGKSQPPNSKECCICLERDQETTLPCTHSFCSQCFQEWSIVNKTCPICRGHVHSEKDTWVLSNVPDSEDIIKEIKKYLISLVENSDDE